MLMSAPNFMGNHLTAVGATGGGKVTGVSGILRTINVCRKFHSNQSSGRCISVKSLIDGQSLAIMALEKL